MNRTRNDLHETPIPREDDPAEKPAAHLSFQLIYANRQERRPGSDTGWRRLSADLFEIPTEGSWELSIREEGDRNSPRGEVETRRSLRVCEVEPFEAAFVPAGTLHRLRWSGRRAGRTAYLLGRFQWMSGLDALRLARLPTVLPSACARPLPGIFERIARISRSKEILLADLGELQELAFRTWRRVMTQAASDRFEPSLPVSARIGPALAFLQENLHDVPSMTELARRSGLSPSHFRSLFKESVGLSPLAHLGRLRCFRASELLVRTDLSMAEIAERCGFESAFYFSRRFRLLMGQAPTKFREGFREGGGKS